MYHWSSEWLYALCIILPLLVLGGCAAVEAGKVINTAICNKPSGCQ